jgi:hypothetical protein
MISISKRSFTLIEVIAAVSLLSLALLGILQGQSGSVQSIVRSEALSQAMFLAQGKMVELEAQLLRRNFEAFPEEESGEFEVAGLEGFRWTQKIESVEVGCFIPTTPDQAEGSGAEAAGLMGFAEGIFENHVRKLTVIVEWQASERPLRAELSQIFVRFSELPSFNLNQ